MSTETEIAPVIISLIVVGTIGGIIYLGYIMDKKQKAKLQEMAMKLGFTFKSGKEFRATMKQELQNAIATSGAVGFSQRMDILGRSWEMTGPYNGVSVLIYPIMRQQGRRTVCYTKFTALFKQKLNAGLKLSKEGFFSKISKTLGGQDIQTGNEEFDKKYIIKGTNESVIMPLLNRSEVQQAINDIFDTYKEATINDDGISIERYGVVTKEELYHGFLDHLTGAVKMFNK